jgi:tRNA pseudouridine55 synthase
MAEGLLLILVDKENKQRTRFENLEKTYELTILFGIETDSYDILGLPLLHQTTALTTSQKKRLHTHLTKLPGTRIQTYPPYSSKTVNGKPLYYYARRNLLGDITLPKRAITISSASATKATEITSVALLRLIRSRLENVSGNFRQKNIGDEWTRILSTSSAIFSTQTWVITCSSGTYMRSISHEAGKVLGCSALALGIKRIRIGEYRLA